MLCTALSATTCDRIASNKSIQQYNASTGLDEVCSHMQCHMNADKGKTEVRCVAKHVQVTDP